MLYLSIIYFRQQYFHWSAQYKFNVIKENIYWIKQKDKPTKLHDRILNPKFINLQFFTFKQKYLFFTMQGQIIVDFQILENLWYIAANYEQIELLFFHHNFCFKGVETSPLKIQSEEISCFFASSVFAFFSALSVYPCVEWSPLKKSFYHLEKIQSLTFLSFFWFHYCQQSFYLYNQIWCWTFWGVDLLVENKEKIFEWSLYYFSVL